jgi:hypothetical protein
MEVARRQPVHAEKHHLRFVSALSWSGRRPDAINPRRTGLREACRRFGVACFGVAAIG